MRRRANEGVLWHTKKSEMEGMESSVVARLNNDAASIVRAYKVISFDDEAIPSSLWKRSV